MSARDEGATRTDERLMGLALAVGRRHLGLTWPNPSVGAVLVDPRDGTARILSQGATAPGGRPHAEPLAIAAAGPAARGATLYVTLEPCSHQGRTPPCVEAIVAAGIARVVTAIADANPLVAGRGHAALRAAGIEVASGVRAAEAGRDHRGHLVRVSEGRPAVTLKLARTADGFAAAREGPRLMITGEPANARTHMRRAQADAILVGQATIAADDPRLDVRLPGLEERRPVRVVIDPRITTPPTCTIVRTAAERPTWVIASEAAAPEAEKRLADLGVVVLRVPVAAGGRVDLAAALRLLGERGLTRVLCEGGPRLAEALSAADLVDEVVLMTSRHRLDRPGLPALGADLGRALARRYVQVEREQVGDDLVESYERRPPCSPAS